MPLMLSAAIPRPLSRTSTVHSDAVAAGAIAISTNRSDFAGSLYLIALDNRLMKTSSSRATSTAIAHGSVAMRISTLRASAISRS
jgi:hypothetical protein